MGGWSLPRLSSSQGWHVETKTTLTLIFTPMSHELKCMSLGCCRKARYPERCMLAHRKVSATINWTEPWLLSLETPELTYFMSKWLYCFQVQCKSKCCMLSDVFSGVYVRIKAVPLPSLLFLCILSVSCLSVLVCVCCWAWPVSSHTTNHHYTCFPSTNQPTHDKALALPSRLLPDCSVTQVVTYTTAKLCFWSDLPHPTSSHHLFCFLDIAPISPAPPIHHPIQRIKDWKTSKKPANHLSNHLIRCFSLNPGLCFDFWVFSHSL